MRLMTYNIRFGGVGRVGALASVVNACAPDVVLLQEATRPDVVEQLAAGTGMAAWAAHPLYSVGFMSRAPASSHRWHGPPRSRSAFLELDPGRDAFKIFGVHLSAVHSNWTERRRAAELRGILASLEPYRREFHVIAGDFNTLAPGEILDIRKLPARLRAAVLLTGRKIRWRTIQLMLDAAYVDAFRLVHPPTQDPGFTFPTWDPHVRLDFVFMPMAWTQRLTDCRVVGGPLPVESASDHLPLLAELWEA